MRKYVKKRIFDVRKRLTAKQEKELREFRKSFPRYKLSKLLDLARFIRPEIFPFYKKNKLNRDMKNGIIEHLNDIEVIMSRLSKKHKREILTHDQFNRTLDQFFSIARQIQTKPIIKTKKGKKEIVGYELQTATEDNLSSVIMFQNFFNIGFQGLIDTMPNEFRDYLISQTKPIVQLMYAMTKQYNSLSRNKIPMPKFPDILVHDKFPKYT